MESRIWLMAGAGALIVVGLLIRWRVSRYDLKDAAIDSAWTIARGQRSAENPTALEARYHDIAAAPTWFGRARRTAGSVIGHFMAQLLGVGALVLVLLGLVLLGVSLFR